MNPENTPDRPKKKCKFCEHIRCIVEDREVKFYCVIDYELEEVYQEDGAECASFVEHR